jgi:hypothetical protein
VVVLLLLLLLLLLLPRQLTSCTRKYLTLYSHCILMRLRLLTRLWLHLWLTFSYYELLLLYLNLLRLLLLWWLKEKY